MVTVVWTASGRLSGLFLSTLYSRTSLCDINRFDAMNMWLVVTGCTCTHKWYF